MVQDETGRRTVFHSETHADAISTAVTSQKGSFLFQKHFSGRLYQAGVFSFLYESSEAISQILITFINKGPSFVRISRQFVLTIWAYLQWEPFY